LCIAISRFEKFWNLITFKKIYFLEICKEGEVKHSSNPLNKSNEMSLVVASECDFRQEN